MRKIKTKIGDIYYDNMLGDTLLYDSDKKWFSDIDKKRLKEIRDITSVGDLPNCCLMENVMWDESEEKVIQDFIDYKNETLTMNDGVSLNEEETNYWKKEAKEWVNRIGNTYFIRDYTEI